MLGRVELDVCVPVVLISSTGIGIVVVDQIKDGMQQSGECFCHYGGFCRRSRSLSKEFRVPFSRRSKSCSFGNHALSLTGSAAGGSTRLENSSSW